MKNKKIFLSRFRFGDFLILAAIIFSSIFLIKSFSSQKQGVVKVRTDSGTYLYNLSENGFYTVDGILGKTTIEIMDEKVRITDSPCPNKTCISQNWGTMLICLPNHVFVTVENDEGILDAITE